MRWEYKLAFLDTTEFQVKSERDLNALGNQGWELVGMLPETPGKARLVFKRRKR